MRQSAARIKLRYCLFRLQNSQGVGCFEATFPRGEGICTFDESSLSYNIDKPEKMRYIIFVQKA